MIFVRRFTRRYFLHAAFIVIFSAATASGLHLLLVNFISSEYVNYPGPARLIDRLDGTDRAQAIRDFRRARGPYIEQDVELLDETGLVLYPSTDPAKTYPVDLVAGLNEPYAFKRIDPSGDRGWTTWLSPVFSYSAVVRLDGTPTRFLRFGAARPARPELNRSWLIPLGIFMLLLAAISFGLMTTLSIVRSILRRYTHRADEVLSALERGDLKARFAIQKEDEVGGAMKRFNQMADRIETLVEHLRLTEEARTKLLRNLAHDLRTPIASLKGLIETLHHRGDKLDERVKRDLLDVAFKEIEYIGRLVDHLLFIAQVQEPTYRRAFERVDLRTIINDEVYDAEFRANKDGFRRAIETEGLILPVLMDGDPMLLQRLFRNALENSMSFARSEVSVTLNTTANSVRVIIDDDGPGFTPDSLKEFGERRAVRRQARSPDGRVSIGLGSEVMKTICQIHHGSLSAENRLDVDGSILGARVRVELSLNAN